MASIVHEWACAARDFGDRIDELASTTPL